jgi:hypothetical protein
LTIVAGDREDLAKKALEAPLLSAVGINVPLQKQIISATLDLYQVRQWHGITDL